MADLIDPDTNCWNLPLIEEVFTMDEAKIISSIPLSPLKPNDLLIWRCMSNGQFTVRSAYHMEKELQTSNKGEGSSSTHNEELWRTGWQLRVPDIVKMFIWRAYNNLLPTKENIFHRKIVADMLCPILVGRRNQ